MGPYLELVRAQNLDEFSVVLLLEGTEGTHDFLSQVCLKMAWIKQSRAIFCFYRGIVYYPDVYDYHKWSKDQDPYKLNLEFA